MQVVGLGILGSLGVPGVLRLSCAVGDCCARFWRDLAAPLPDDVASLAIYSRTDGVVDWRACIDRRGPALEVAGATHCGMIAHPAALHAVGEALQRWAADVRDHPSPLTQAA